MTRLTDLVMPKLGLTMTEGRIAEWCVAAGGRVASGDVLLVVETDKIANEIEAPGAGEVREILVAAGETVPVGTVIARWTGPGLPTADRDQTEGATAASDRTGGGSAHAPSAGRSDSGRRVATPLARRLARQHGIDLDEIAGTGPGRRIRARDVERVREMAAKGAPAARRSFPAGSRRIEPTRHQMVAAQRLEHAKRDIPHFYLTAEAEVSRFLALKEELAEDARLPRLTATHLFLAAMGRALTELPAANRIWADDGFLAFGAVDIGIAVQSADGLIVPVLRDVAGKTLQQVAIEATALVERARRGDIVPDDVSGGALTLSNLGMHGVSRVIPIINPPHSAILGIGSLQQVFRPNAAGQPELRREIGLALAADHRVLDGVNAAALLNAIIRHVEHPYRLFYGLSEKEA
jgi:pyruvate dehydrogenase E2 component (dihydrolipoamide acetyltransferase)